MLILIISRNKNSLNIYYSNIYLIIKRQRIVVYYKIKFIYIYKDIYLLEKVNT